MAVLMPQGYDPQEYKESRDLYERAKAILEHKRDGKILPAEDAMLFYAFHVLKRESEGYGPEWDAVAEAGKLAINGYGVKQGSVRPCTNPQEAPDEA